MCSPDAVLSSVGLGGGSRIEQAPPDPKAEREKAQGEAAAAANAKSAEARRARKRQSLLASGGGSDTGAPATSTVIAQGKPKLGS